MAPTKNELIDSAQRFIQKGQLDKAIRDYQQVLQLDAGDIQTRLRLGDLYVKKGNKAEAIQQYVRVAEKHAADGFYVKAIAVHKQILKLDPGFIDSSARLADLYHKQGLLSEALAQYQVVAAYHDKRGDVRDALDTLTKMADLDPQNVGIRLKLGDLYLKANIKESGIDQLLRAAELLGRAGKVAEQVKVLERIGAAQPANPGANRTLVNLLLGAGQVEPALARLSAVLAKSPDDADLRELQADALLKAGEPARAQDALRALLEHFPDHLAVRARLIGLLLDAGDLAGAEAELAALGPDRLEADQHAEAVSILRALAEREPAPLDEALAAIQRQLAALGEDPGSEGAPATLARASAAAEAPIDALLQVEAAGAAPGPPDADLTIEIESPADAPVAAPAGRAAPGALGYGEIEIDGDTTPLDGGLLDAGTTEPGRASSVDGGGFDLVLEVEEGREPDHGALAREGPPSGSSLDLLPDPGAAALVGGGPAGDAAPLDQPGGAAAGGPLASPESVVIARSEPELALDQIPEELEEAEFFVEQGLIEAARVIYRKILAVDPEHPQALARLEALSGAGPASRTRPAPAAAARPAAPAAPAPAAPARPAAPAAPAAPARPAAPAAPAAPVASARPAARREPAEEADAGSFDLAAVLSDVSTDAGGGLLFDPEEQVSFQEVFREFKKGVERQVGDDAETHYNLGIAYKEMGLIDDAIAEFERALSDPRRTFDCYTMLGLSHLARGDARSAIAAFQRGLDHGMLDPSRSNALTYELGLAFEAAGRLADARTAFSAVASADPAYRDVAAKLEALAGVEAAPAFDPRSLIEPDAAGAARVRPAAPSRPAARRDKISFV